MIDRKTLEKIEQLELYVFYKNNELSNSRYEFFHNKFIDDFDTVDDYLAALKRYDPLPFFMSSCVMKSVETFRMEFPNGETQIKFHHEWDFYSMNIFNEGVQWAEDNGLKLPKDWKSQAKDSIITS